MKVYLLDPHFKISYLSVTSHWRAENELERLIQDQLSRLQDDQERDRQQGIEISNTGRATVVLLLCQWNQLDTGNLLLIDIKAHADPPNTPHKRCAGRCSDVHDHDWYCGCRISVTNSSGWAHATIEAGSLHHDQLHILQWNAPILNRN